MPNPLVVFCHLRWNFVFQRPQHLMTRFGAARPVLFVEEPVHDPAGEWWEFIDAAPGVTVCRPHTPVAEPGFNEAQYPALRRLVARLLRDRATDGYDLWCYTPMAFPVADDLMPRAVAYDCMDELSAFRFAPPQLLANEDRLLDRADVVFTGGPSLFKSKKSRHANAHCFSSSVDAAHFGQAANPLPDPPEQAAVPRPRLGYFGVIDERFDVALLAAAAAARPNYQFMMVGPVVKIDQADLPRRPNIHYAGQQTYARLPAFLSGWDVALLPFARNESTKFISPTKTLEYMAAGKPIVSTPITDVAEPYGDMVRLADTADEFVAACDAALTESDADRDRRRAQYAAVLANTSWDRTAAAMAAELEKAARPVNRVAAQLAASESGDAPVVVIGAGPTGLSAAYHLGENSVLVEACDRVGGWCRSIEEKGFTFDYAGHIMFSNDLIVHDMYKMLLGDNVHWQDREAWIFSHDVHTRYPFQGSLYGLPADVIKECILGAVEARYGGISAPPGSNGNGNGKAAGNGHTNGNGNGNGHTNGNGKAAACSMPGADPKDAPVSDCCGDGVAESTLKAAGFPGPAKASEPPKNFAEFIDKVWGKGIGKHFAVPYNKKIWAVPLEDMETSWLGGRVPMPDLGEMIEGALSPKPKPMGPNARFGYPLRGGFQALMDGFLPHLKGDLLLSARVDSIDPLQRVVTLTDGRHVRYSNLITTMPLPALIKALGDHVPAEVSAAAKALRHTSVRCVNIGVGREKLTDKHWIYYPGDTVFHRIFVQGNASPHCNPPGGFGLTCEITYGPLKPLPCDGQALIDLCVKDCIRVGLVREDDPILVTNQVDMPCAYVVYDHARASNVSLVRNWLEGHGIIPAGRYAEWEYYNSDHAFLAGRKAAERVRGRHLAAV